MSSEDFFFSLCSISEMQSFLCLLLLLTATSPMRTDPLLVQHGAAFISLSCTGVVKNAVSRGQTLPLTEKKTVYCDVCGTGRCHGALTVKLTDTLTFCLSASHLF